MKILIVLAFILSPSLYAMTCAGYFLGNRTINLTRSTQQSWPTWVSENQQISLSLKIDSNKFGHPGTAEATLFLSSSFTNALFVGGASPHRLNLDFTHFSVALSGRDAEHTLTSPTHRMVIKMSKSHIVGLEVYKKAIFGYRKVFASTENLLLQESSSSQIPHIKGELAKEIFDFLVQAGAPWAETDHNYRGMNAHMLQDGSYMLTFSGIKNRSEVLDIIDGLVGLGLPRNHPVISHMLK